MALFLDFVTFFEPFWALELAGRAASSPPTPRPPTPRFARARSIRGRLAQFQPNFFEEDLVNQFASAITGTTLSWPNTSVTTVTMWKPVPPKPSAQLVDAFCRLHNAAVALREAWDG